MNFPRPITPGISDDHRVLMPRYDGACLAGVMPAIADAIGVNIPAQPSVGINGIGTPHAGSNVDPAAFSGARHRETLKLPASKQVCVVLIDGLGWNLLRERSGHAPFLRSLLADGTAITAGFPTTTVTSMAMFGAGRGPGASRIAGYTVRDPKTLKLVNLLAWKGVADPASWQPHATVFEQIVAAGRPVLRTGAPHFAESGLTKTALRGGDFAGFTDLADGVDLTLDHIRRHRGGVTYLYWWEIDRVGHHMGWKSMEWGEQLEAVDYQIQRLVKGLTPGTQLVLTADHGMVDVALSNRRNVADEPGLREGVEAVGGEPRMCYLYCQPAQAQAVKQRWQNELGDGAWVLTREEAIDFGLFGVTAESTLPVIGDVVVLMLDDTAIVDSRSQPPHSMKLIGLHGSLTPDEVEIPLLTYQA